ncbi:hypothetical protein AnigIFM49718_004647 [Aspergillus niger]|nr:hypothetical protein AnigIFM49718_004647 [Aspergillus niger]
MAEESFATALSSGEITVELFHQRHITYLHQIIRASAHDGALRRQLWMADTERQRRLIGEMAAANLSHHQQLHWEKVAHAQTRQALEVEKNLHLQMRTVIDRQEHTLSSVRAALNATEQALGLERERSEEMAAELDRTLRKFHLVDTLVDTMLLQEDIQLDMPDRSRQITDLILDLERQMEERYRALLSQKDVQIARLQDMLGSLQKRTLPGRAQSEPAS